LIERIVSDTSDQRAGSPGGLRLKDEEGSEQGVREAAKAQHRAIFPRRPLRICHPAMAMPTTHFLTMMEFHAGPGIQLIGSVAHASTSTIVWCFESRLKRELALHASRTGTIFRGDFPEKSFE
jgi:hypothetical protein